jgi:hypothetical protein
MRNEAIDLEIRRMPFLLTEKTQYLSNLNFIQTLDQPNRWWRPFVMSKMFRQLFTDLQSF